MSILTDDEIFHAVENGDIVVDPFDASHVNPTSYDVTLGDQVCVYADWVENARTNAHARSMLYGIHGPDDGEFLKPVARFDQLDILRFDAVFDIKTEPKTTKFTIDPGRGWVLKPDIGYLMHTVERVHTKKYVAILDGKSSIGRLFMKVHETAGYIDPGFVGQITMEVTVQHPIRVYPGMRVAQIRFNTMRGTLRNTYDRVGHYTGESAKGPVPSQAWKRFR